MSWTVINTFNEDLVAFAYLHSRQERMMLMGTMNDDVSCCRFFGQGKLPCVESRPKASHAFYICLHD